MAKIPATIAHTSQRTMQEIGGNMMAGPVALALLQSICWVAPWRSSSNCHTVTTEDVEAAMTLFQTITELGAGEESEQPSKKKRLRKAPVERG